MLKIYFKKKLKELLFFITKYNFSWFLIRKTFEPLLRLYWKAEFFRNKYHIPKAEIKSKYYLNFIKKIKRDLVVLNGPFSGMKYPAPEACGSAFLPKILGSYESEIIVFINYILKQDYKNIIDIGCAEGYYAVGLGMKLKKAKLFAFDTDKYAQQQCKKMAKINNLEININGLFTKNSYKKYTKSKNSLFIMDCEGYEKNLIDKETALDNQNCDFLIEAHDFLDIYITEHIINAFRMTHEIEVIESVDDISKVYNYKYKELSGMTLTEKKEILSEYRPKIMRWIFARSKKIYKV